MKLSEKFLITDNEVY